MMIASLMFVSLPLAAACLNVSEQGMAALDSEPGAGQIQWHAQIDNRCALSQDALLTVQFVNEDGQSAYEVRDQLVIGRMGTERISREVYVPAYHMASIRDIRIKLEERERPF
jgi:hypothetical protein